jgi:hypothetical protein
MAGEGYRGGGTVGGKVGCALAAVVGLPLLGLAILISVLGDCMPDAPCNHDPQWWLILGALAFSLAVGAVVRTLINRLAERRGKDRERPSTDAAPDPEIVEAAASEDGSRRWQLLRRPSGLYVYQEETLEPEVRLVDEDGKEGRVVADASWARTHVSGLFDTREAAHADALAALPWLGRALLDVPTA